MVRFFMIASLGIVGVVAANAGSVQIGGASGLTSNYILQGAGAVCAAGPGNCVTGSTTGWIEKNYVNTLFSAATNTGGTVSPVPFTGYVQSGGEPSGLTASDLSNGTKFAMISDGGTASNNFWGSTGLNLAQTSIVIPIGIEGVTDVSTMMDNQWGTLGGNDTSVTFYFGTSSDATTGLTAIEVDLTNSSNNGVTPGGEIRAALACNVTTSLTCNAATNPHGALQSGVSINGVTVNTGVIYNTFNYTAASPTGYYAGTAGKLKLDDQQFVFDPSLLDLWLVSVKVTENVGDTPANILATQSGHLPSSTALSAITVDTATVDTATPEPTTVLLLLSGLGGIGLIKRYRRT